jgi:small subunit ribosomal protein S20
VPQRRTSIKELRKNQARHSHNLDMKSDLKKAIKKFLASVRAKNGSEAQSNLKLLYKKLDKAMKRNLLHKNTVARRKSLFTRQLAGLSS